MKISNGQLIIKRISAYLIDIMFVFLMISLISGIKILNPTYDKYVESYEEYVELLDQYSEEKITLEEYTKEYSITYYNVTKYSISYNIVIILSMLLYFGVFQKYNNGQTLGKKLMKLKVVKDNDENITLLSSLIRVIPMFFVYVGSVIPLIINSVLVFIVKPSNYMILSISISYIFVFINIISLLLIIFKKNGKGIHEILTKTKVIYIN